jgi:hypothetical protein
MLFVGNVRLDSSINVLITADYSSKVPEIMFMAPRYDLTRPFGRCTPRVKRAITTTAGTVAPPHAPPLPTYSSQTVPI